MSYLTGHWSFDPFLILALVVAGWHEIGLVGGGRRFGRSAPANGGSGRCGSTPGSRCCCQVNTSFSEQGFNTCLYWENPDPKKNVSYCSQHLLRLVKECPILLVFLFNYVRN